VIEIIYDADAGPYEAPLGGALPCIGLVIVFFVPYWKRLLFAIVCLLVSLVEGFVRICGLLPS